MLKFITTVILLIFVCINCEDSSNFTANNIKYMEYFNNRLNVDRMRNLTVATDLPTTVQSSNRILVVIATPNLVHRQNVLRQLLSNYLTACEQGYEIHIVFSAHSHLKIEAFSHNMLYYCKRLSSALPIAFTTSDADFNNYLLAVHRYVFLLNPNNYDYFLNQEDDISITVENLNYYFKWSSFFSEKNKSDVFLPGFRDYEALYAMVNVTTGFKYLPAVVGMDHFDILNVSGEYFIRYGTSVARWFLLSKEKLLRLSLLPQWFDDLVKPYSEPNVHFQNRWLARHYLQLESIRDLLHSLTYHSSNTYTSNYIVANKMNLGYGLDIHAYAKFMITLLGPKIIEQSKLGLDLRSAEWTIKYNDEIFNNDKVQNCLESGKQPFVEFYFSNNFDSLFNKVVNLTHLNVYCNEKHLAPQNNERCKEEDWTICHRPDDVTFIKRDNY